MERLDTTRPNNTRTRAIAKEEGKNPEFAAHPWNNGGFSSRMLSLLILEIKKVDVANVEMMIAGIEAAGGREQSQLPD
ncbi:MAG TPA: hypothetical protein VE913_19660 [Longimicrobium sp.]|nr:hypothetical protein [Longimicrobium sp.]